MQGKVFSTDKSVWMQGRCAWIFAYLCHVYGVKEEWLGSWNWRVVSTVRA